MSPASKPLLRDLAPAALSELLATQNQPAYRGGQLARWLFRRGALEWKQLTDLPHPLRQDLATNYDLRALTLRERVVSQDGTRKFLFGLRDGHSIESVLIPMADHTTFCLSSQVGCAMACRFCATAHGGLTRQLSSGEILEQVSHLQSDLQDQPVPGHGDRAFNIVLMGMGEPLDNWSGVNGAVSTLLAPSGSGLSTRRITLSTSGHAEGLVRLLASPLRVGLTLSLCGVTEARRRRLMPAASRTPLVRLLELAERYARRIRRRVTIAYILIAEQSDGTAEAERLVSLTRRRPFKINLIPLNELAGEDLEAPAPERVRRFQEVLTQGGLLATVRTSSGADIAAACGQLRSRREKERPA